MCFREFRILELVPQSRADGTAVSIACSTWRSGCGRWVHTAAPTLHRSYIKPALWCWRKCHHGALCRTQGWYFSIDSKLYAFAYCINHIKCDYDSVCHQINNLRLPKEGGRLKGFGDVDFEDRESLVNAMNLPDLVSTLPPCSHIIIYNHCYFLKLFFNR